MCHILEGNKNFEVRLNDRDYQVGDEVHFLPLEDKNYLAYNLCDPIPRFRIKYLHSGLGMDGNYVVLGIETIEETK